MKIKTRKKATIHLDNEEAMAIRRLFGEMSFNSYLELLGDKDQAEFTQLLGGQLFDTLQCEGF